MIQATDAARRALADLLARSPEPGRTARLLIDDYTWGGPRMGVALEEPREGDEMVDLGGVALALPRDVRMVLRAYRSAVVDHDPRWGGNLGFFVRYDRGSWRCWSAVAGRLLAPVGTGRRPTRGEAREKSDREEAAGSAEERRLVAAAKAGDPEARERIVLLYQEMVYNLALRMTRDPQEAAVILQETFLKVFRALPRFRAGSLLSTWVYRIATNEALQLLRLRRGRAFVDIDALEADPEEDLTIAAGRLADDPHRLLESRELRDHLGAAIDALPPKHRAAFVLVDIEGLPAREAAAAAGVKTAALKTDLRRARLFLRDRLAGYLRGESDERR